MESGPAGTVTSRSLLRHRARAGVVLALITVTLVLTGCSKPSRSDKISARDDASFALWLARHGDAFTPAEMKEIDTARQQIKYKVMQSRPGLMSAEFASAVYDEIEGRTVDQLLLTGYALQIERMKTELQNYEPQLKKFHAHQQNQHLSGDQKTYVAESLEKLQRLMRERQEELSRLNERLSELEQQTGQK